MLSAILAWFGIGQGGWNMQFDLWCYETGPSGTYACD